MFKLIRPVAILLSVVAAALVGPSSSADAAPAYRTTTAVAQSVAASIPWSPKVGANGNCWFANRIHHRLSHYDQAYLNTFTTSDGETGCWVVRRKDHRRFDALVEITKEIPGRPTRVIQRVFRGVRSASGFPNINNRWVTVEVFMNRPTGRSSFGHIGWGKVTFPKG